MTTDQKKQELEKIAREIKAFKGLDIAKNATHAVPGEGDPDAAIMFIGESPGYNEDMQGRPFVGQAGMLLEKTLLEVLGLKRGDVYITNIVKFRPPDNRDPFDNEIAACADWLDRQIKIISPKIIVTLGRFSMTKFIPGVTISQIHGVARYYQPSTMNYQLIIFPMYHPAAALRGTTMMNAFKADFVKLKNLLAPQARRRYFVG
ncbi:MAG: Phage DNA polymerase-related protein [Candidatus Amesbacteria bacterium GW2011_GWA2_47_70]|nr:MAG: Phage DNA polymerase-related protein [Candidatus Amesbacteria bacterium GW2011_GWA2_47_70]